jgi:hypothetical protein
MDASESTPLWPDTPEEFCAALKAARQRRGLTLAEISQQTKVTESHFVALERADLRHWPKGIFRRAFFANYVRAIGLPVEPAVGAFTRLFPDPSAAPPEVSGAVSRARAPEPRPGGAEMRLALARGPLIPPGAAARAMLAVFDAAVVVAAAGAGAWIVNADLATIVAIVGLSYYSLAVIIGRPHPGPMLLMRALRPLSAMRRVPVGSGQLSLVRNLNRAVGRLRPHLTRIGTSVRRSGKWPAIDLSLLKRIEWSRFKRLDLQRLREATPHVIDRLRHGRAERDRADRPMARPRPDSPRHARRRQDSDGDGGVRVRIRLPRREQ